MTAYCHVVPVMEIVREIPFSQRKNNGDHWERHWERWSLIIVGGGKNQRNISVPVSLMIIYIYIILNGYPKS